MLDSIPGIIEPDKKTKVLTFLLTALVYGLLAEAAQWLIIGPSGRPPFWPAAGFALTAVLLWGDHMLLAIWLGCSLFNITRSQDPILVAVPVAMVSALGPVFQAGISAFVARTFQPLYRSRQLLLYVVLMGPIGCLFSATWSLCFLIAIGKIPVENFFELWRGWWLADTLGVLCLAFLAPTIAAVRGDFKKALVMMAPILFIMAIAIALFVRIRQIEVQALENSFQDRVHIMQAGIAGRINHNVDMLFALGSYCEATPDMKREQFSKFAARLRLQNPEIRALEWIPKVSDAARDEVEAAVRAAGFDDFMFFRKDADFVSVPAERKPTYYPVLFVEPFAPNKAAFGFDLGSSSSRLKTLMKACELGEAVATPPIRLVQEPEKGNGLLMVLPVYYGTQTNCEEVKGFVVSVLAIPLLIEQTLTLNQPDMMLRVEGFTERGKLRPLYFMGPDCDTFSDPQAIAEQWASASPVQHQVSYEFAHQTWRLNFALTEASMNRNRLWGAWSAMIAGCGLAALFGVLMLRAYRQQQEIEEKVQERTEALAQANVALEQEMEERRRMEVSLIEARDASEQAARAKSAFLAAISHEVRTPLNGIIGMSRLMLGNKLTGDNREFAETIATSADVLLRLVNDVLDYSKVEAGKMTLEVLDFNLVELIHETVRMHQSSANEKKLELTTHVDENVPNVVLGDSMRLQQVLNNLLSNAIKFTQTGSVSVAVATQEASEENFMIRIQVMDSGIGIPKNRQEELFKPFTQLDTSTARMYGGTGLGLVICKELVEMMEGAIGVESLEQAGSTFWFTVCLEKPRLPHSLKPPSYNRIRAGEKPQSVSYLGMRVLLVEDNPVNQKVAGRMLERMDFGVVVVENGREALAKLDAETFDFVLMDVVMPIMDGLTATREIRKRGALADLPVIAMTANVQSHNQAECLDAGMNDFIAKPVRQEVLAKTLLKWVQPRTG